MKQPRYFAIISLAIILLSVFSACNAKSAANGASGEAPAESGQQEIEGILKKPTAAEAAKHNEAIDPVNIRLIQFDDPELGDKIAVISTTEGDIKVRLFNAQAPKTVSAFIKLAEEGRYNGGKFAESVDGYKIDGAGKADDLVFSEDEFSLDLWNFSGAVAVSNNGSNFMIITANYSLNSKSELEGLKFPEPVVKKYLDIGGAPHQDWKNTVFGQVIEGMEVADKISTIKDGEPAEIIEIKIEVV